MPPRLMLVGMVQCQQRTLIEATHGYTAVIAEGEGVTTSRQSSQQLVRGVGTLDMPPRVVLSILLDSSLRPRWETRTGVTALICVSNRRSRYRVIDLPQPLNSVTSLIVDRR